MRERSRADRLGASRRRPLGAAAPSPWPRSHRHERCDPPSALAPKDSPARDRPARLRWRAHAASHAHRAIGLVRDDAPQMKAPTTARASTAPEQTHTAAFT
jgi:hypothetical protein